MSTSDLKQVIFHLFSPQTGDCSPQDVSDTSWAYPVQSVFAIGMMKFGTTTTYWIHNLYSDHTGLFEGWSQSSLDTPAIFIGENFHDYSWIQDFEADFP